jgi:polysaccharide pyruvyl transferase WcaK-like protein
MFTSNVTNQREITNALNTDNAGDHIIMGNCLLHLDELVETQNAVRVSTHRIPDADDDWGATKIVCGTNILSCRMSKYGLWKLPRNLKNYRNITLMGVGFDSYNTESELYTKLLLRHMLSKDGYHSVRDSFSEKMLKSMGIQNVLNTGCPTMWNLTSEHCAAIPRKMARNVVCTVTDYSRDVKNDSVMLDILLASYAKVYLWLQGRDDLTYIRELGYENKLALVNSTLEAYDDVLTQDDLDYVGTRLHAGIRALSKRHRSLIVSIDNRAECISADTGLPTIRREDIPFALKERLEAELETKIDLPWANIQKWKEQFKEQK